MSDAAATTPAPCEGMNTVLYCRRWRETVAFYEQVLGLPRGFENDWFVEFRVSDAARLSVADAARASIDSAGGAGITVTLQVDDVRAWHTRLSDRGLVPPPVGPRPWSAEGFLVHDPEGHRLEIWAPRP